MNDNEELFDILDENEKVIDHKPRNAVHGNPSLRHRAVHVLVFDDAGRIFLQKRKKNKQVQPGKWDSSVGGHVLSGEDTREAAYREMYEELGITGIELDHLFDFVITNEIETEHVCTYSTVWNGSFALNENEIEDGRFWTREEMAACVGTGTLTPSFEREFEKLSLHSNSHP